MRFTFVHAERQNIQENDFLCLPMMNKNQEENDARSTPKPEKKTIKLTEDEHQNK